MTSPTRLIRINTGLLVRVQTSVIEAVAQHGKTIARLRAEKQALQEALDAKNAALESAWLAIVGAGDQNQNQFAARCAILDRAARGYSAIVSASVTVTSGMQS